MPKYYEFKVAGYYLYFTSFCVVECMHVHASDRKLTETGSAKLFVKNNGDTVVQNKGLLNDREMAKIQQFIKENYKEMYIHWLQYSNNGFYEKQDGTGKKGVKGFNSPGTCILLVTYDSIRGKSGGNSWCCHIRRQHRYP